MAEPRTLLIDIEGTVAFQGSPIPGAATAIRRLRDAGYRMKCLTNTDSKTGAGLHSRLAGMGLPIAAGDLFTPVDALV